MAPVETIADAGLLGMLNAGKSTFLSSVSTAENCSFFHNASSRLSNINDLFWHSVKAHQALVSSPCLGHVERCRVLFIWWMLPPNSQLKTGA